MARYIAQIYIYQFAKVLNPPTKKNPDFATVHQKEKFEKTNMQCVYDVNLCSKKKTVLGTTPGLHQGIFTQLFLEMYFRP